MGQDNFVPDTESHAQPRRKGLQKQNGDEVLNICLVNIKLRTVLFDDQTYPNGFCFRAFVCFRAFDT